MTVSIRPAVAGDLPFIVTLVRAERLNPTDLDWRRFTVAVAAGDIVGAVQVRRNKDGARELGSLVVRPDMRGRGLAARLIDAALDPVADEVWMITGRAFVGHYGRWGFLAAARGDAPRSLRHHLMMGRAVGLFFRLIGRPPKDLTLLCRARPAGVQAAAAAGIRR